MIPRSRRIAAVAALAVCLVGGCGSSEPTTSSSAGTGTSGAPAASAPTPIPSPATGDGQTDTDWGRIWDWVPAGFPTYVGATPSDETNLGPASEVDVVNGAKAAAVVAWYEHELQGAGYATDALNGPMEDGSYTLDMRGQPAGCRLEVAAAPMGGGSVLGITVRYGAACPNG